MFTFLPCASHSHQVYWKQRDILGMDEGRGKGGSMKKSIQIVMTLICFAVGVGSAIFYFVMTRPNNGDSITAIGQTYEGSHISATAYDIKTFELQEKKQALVVVGFEIKNISKRSQVLVNSATYKAYVDDVAAETEPLFQYDEYLDADLAPGKRAKGYWGILVPADAKTVEIQVDDNYLRNKTAVFVLDVPPAESMTLEDYFASLNG